MITPRFHLFQDEKTLSIKIRAPYCCLRELEVDAEDNSFLFLCKPYYLRLQLPGNILEENGKSSFDSDTGEFTFTYEKANPNEVFENLDFITKFLVTKVEASYGEGERKITVLASNNYSEKTIPQTLDVSQGFGFALQHNKNFVNVSSEFSEIFEVDPCEVTLAERRKLRLQYEQGKFNMDHYLSDFVEDEEIKLLISQKTPWEDLEKSMITFTTKELDFLKDLLNVEYNLTEQQVNYAFNGLLDILFAYCYDKRTTNFEGTSESGWTIVKLSSTLCWLDAFENPREALVSSFRRSIIYPLYRHYILSVKVMEDLKKLIQLGEQYIIKCLIEVYDIFLGGDCCRYILNNIFIKDYITYAMKWERERWKQCVENVMIIKMQKEELGLNLVEIEQGYILDKKLANLKVKDSDSDDSSGDSDDSSDGSDSDSSDSSETDSDYSSNKEIFKFLC